MRDLKCILCPVDFSDASEHAAQHALAIAQWCSAKIVALYVYDPVAVAGTSLAVSVFEHPDEQITKLRIWSASILLH